MVDATHTTFIDGRFEASEGNVLLQTVNPATEEALAEVVASSPAQVERAIASARAAFDHGAWAGWGPDERADLLLRIVDVLEERREELVELIVSEVGTPISLARALQVGGPIASLRWYAGAARQGPRGGYVEGLPLHYDPVTTASHLVREPVGVVAAMTAYNYPLNLLAWKLGGAIASGCTTVVLPSPRGVLSTVAFLRCLDAAGVPPGVVNLVVGGPDVGQRLTSAPDIDLVTFTGSDPVGAQIMKQAAPSLKRLVLELGGKSPNILLPDVDLDTALEPSLLRFVRNAGQGCAATTRILVPADRYDEVAEAAAEVLGRLAVGDPMDPATVVGPVITAAHREGVERRLDEAVAAGAELIAGGGRPDIPRGFYLEPTLLGGLRNDHPVCQDELFAPVASLLPYRSVDEAVAIANDSRYGLAATVFGSNAAALEVAGRLRVGSVMVNGGGGLRPDAPWGGYGMSGLGREMGLDGFSEFFEVKHIQWPVDGAGRPQA